MRFSRRLAIIAVSAIVFPLVAPLAGIQFWAFLKPPHEFVLLSAWGAWALALGLIPGVISGLFFGMVINLTPTALLFKMVQPPLRRGLTWFAFLGLCAVICAALLWIGLSTLVNVVKTMDRGLELFYQMMIFAVPGGLIAGAAMRPITSLVIGANNSSNVDAREESE